MIIQFWLSTPEDPIFHEVSKGEYDDAASRTTNVSKHAFVDFERNVFGSITYGGERP